MIFTFNGVLPGTGLPPVVITGSGPIPQNSDPLFVIPSGATSGECASWGTACDLQYASTIAAAPAELWVKMGMYTPTSGTDQTASFQLKNGVGLYGGFSGTETARDQRDPGVNLTTLSGEIGSATTYDNSYHVVNGSGIDNTAVLDGFTIIAGNATGAAPDQRAGGGMVIVNGSPILTNVTFSNNSASSNGGGLYCSGGGPELNNVTFNGNHADSSGGGMFLVNGSSPVLTNVTFSDNTAATDGGGLASSSSSSSPNLTNVTFSGNSADEGGGLYNQLGSDPTLTNVTFSSNSANQGGALYNSGSSPTLENVTIAGNSAVDHGGGMYIADLSYPQFHNTIFWGNTAAGGIGAQIYNFSGDTTSSDSVVQGGCADTSWSCGTNIIITDPKLGALGYYGGFTQTIPILAGSSAIDTGNDSTCPATDQRGISRPQGAHCDIGAFEFEWFSIWIYLPLVIR